MGGAAHFHSWPMGLAVLLALVATSLAVAGPRAMAERDPAGLREHDPRSRCASAMCRSAHISASTAA